MAGDVFGPLGGFVVYDVSIPAQDVVSYFCCLNVLDIMIDDVLTIFDGGSEVHVIVGHRPCCCCVRGSLEWPYQGVHCGSPDSR